MVKRKKLNKKPLGILSCLMATLITCSLFNQTEADAAKLVNQTVNFPNSVSQSQSKTVTLPIFESIEDVKVNTGNVNYSMSGRNMTLNVNNGTSTGRQWNDYVYSDYVTKTIGGYGPYFSDTYYYSNAGYYGNIYKNGSAIYLYGSEISYDYYDVSNQDSEYYNQNGYSGYLTKYVASGSAPYNAPKDIDKYFSTTCIDYYIWDNKKKKWRDGEGGAKFPNTYYYNKGGYSGTLHYVSGTQSACDSTPPTYKGSKGETATVYNGTGTKRYRGTVYKPMPDTRVYKYKGTVYRPYSDNRYFQQDYSGYVWKGDYENLYGYNVTISYLENTPPEMQLTSPTDNTAYYRGANISVNGTVKDTDTNDNVTIKWNVDNGPTQTLETIKATGEESTFSFDYEVPSGLTDGTHTINVWAEDDSTKGNKSTVISKKFYVNPFVTPGTPTFTNVTNSSFTVSFNKGNNVADTTYELYRLNDDKKIDLGKSTSLNESGLGVNEQFQYKVRAKNTIDGYTPYSSISTVYTKANKPTGGSIDDSVDGQAILDWEANGNPSNTTYHYEIRNKSTNAVVKKGEVNDTHVKVTDIPTDVYYNVYVKAVNGDGIATDELSLGTLYQDATPPTATYSISPTSWINGDVTITYNATDSGTGVRSIELPNGEKKTPTGTALTYKVEHNGTYKFIATDNSDNERVTNVVVTNIDKEKPAKPTIVVKDVPNTDTQVYFTITDNGDGDGSGVQTIQYRISNGAWQNYVAGKQVYVPNNKTGLIPVEARVTDKVGLVSDITLDYAIVDNTPPVINSVKVTKEGEQPKLVVDATDDIGLIENGGYRYYQQHIGEDSQLEVIKGGWIGDSKIDLPIHPSSNLYIYQVEVRDYKNHIVKSEKVPYISTPIIDYAGIKGDGAANTATFEFNENIGKDVAIKVYREGEYVAKLVDGKQFIDEGLDYERDYHYEFVAEATVDGKTVKSDPITKTIKVGKPLLEVSLDKKQLYKTTFSDEFNVTGTVIYRKGGNLSFDLMKDGNKITSSSISVAPYVKTKWKLTSSQLSDANMTYDVVADLIGYENTGLYKREYTVKVGKKDVTVKNITDYSKYGIYK